MKHVTRWLGTLVLLPLGLLTAQTDMQDAVQNLAQDAAQKYVHPVVSGFGSNLNTGWFHRAPKASKFGFNVEVGMVFMGTMFNKKDKTFTSHNTLTLSESDAGFFAEAIINGDPTLSDLDEDDLLRTQAIAAITDQLIGREMTIDISGATVIGRKNDRIRVTYGAGAGTVTYGGNTYSLDNTTDTTDIGGLLNTPVVPLLAPQITVGTIMGTQLTLRYLPPIKADEKIGTIEYAGFGIQHNPQVWFGKVIPVDVAVAYYHQTLKQGKLFEATANAYGVTASKQFGFRLLNITPYAGFLLESSEMKFKYDFEYLLADGTPASAKISFKEKGNNTSRLTIGTNIRFLVVNINADYSIAKNTAYSVGVNFAL